MPGNSFGEIFRITSFGESHGLAIGVVIDGCPPGLELDMQFIQNELNRRRPGQSAITTQRKEADKFDILSGVFDNKTTGTHLALVIRNKDAKSKDYSHIADKFRPSHADMTYARKYGIRDYRGGGRSSARETATRVVAGAIAKLFLNSHGISIQAGVTQVGNIKLEKPIEDIDFSLAANNIVRCPDPELAYKMEQGIKEIRKQGDTVGGIISCIINNCPVGLGEPVFDKLHADLAKAMLSINAVKGFEYGSGFNAAGMKGSQHNDLWTKSDDSGQLQTSSNHSGGIQGGISNGMPIYFNVAFKPVATLMKDQDSVDEQGDSTVIKGKGRHDPCVVPRAVPIVEAMSAIVIADHLLRNKMYQ
jgi:chorismate synthase